MDDVNVQLARFEERMVAGFKAIDQRFEDQNAQSQRQHEENVDRMDRIEGHAERTEVEVRRTNGRVTRLEEQIRTIFRFINAKASAAVKDVGDRTGISRRDVTVFVAGGGGVIAAWKFLEWGVHLLKGLP